MRLSKTGYYADFVVYPLLLVVLGWAAFRTTASNQRWEGLLVFVAGVFLWTLLEYLLHRHILHRLKPFKGLHDLHHARPTDLVGTPTWLSVSLFAGLALLLWGSTDAGLAGGLTAGLMLGYLWYVSVHHAVHHIKARSGSWLYRAKLRHAMHHQPGRPCNFGVTTGLWDVAFRSTRRSV